MSVRSYSLPAAPDEIARTVGKFLTTFAIGFLLYGLAVIAVYFIGEAATGQLTSATQSIAHDPDGPVSFIREFGEFVYEYRAYALMVTLPAVPAALLHLHLPERTVDRYHRLGKAFAMFLTVNLSLSGMFLLNEFARPNGPELSVLSFIAYFSLASAFLPGPYLGIILGARWSR